MKAITLNDKQLNEVLTAVPSRYLQAKRFIRHLANNPDSISSNIVDVCGVSNISDIARKVNPSLAKIGLLISCKRPIIVPTTFKSSPIVFLWGIYNLPNDL